MAPRDDKNVGGGSEGESSSSSLKKKMPASSKAAKFSDPPMYDELYPPLKKGVPASKAPKFIAELSLFIICSLFYLGPASYAAVPLLFYYQFTNTGTVLAGLIVSSLLAPSTKSAAFLRFSTSWWHYFDFHHNFPVGFEFPQNILDGRYLIAMHPHGMSFILFLSHSLIYSSLPTHSLVFLLTNAFIFTNTLSFCLVFSSSS
jgi:hypothetical protein